MKQIRYFRARFDKAVSLENEGKALKVYLPDSRLYHTFEIGEKQLAKLKKLFKLSVDGTFEEWKREISSRLEEDNIVYFISPFASNESTPTASELLIFDVFDNELTANRVCKCFNDFFEHILTMKPDMSVVNKIEKELTVSNFTFYYNLQDEIFRLYYTNDQQFVFTVVFANSLSGFIMKTQDLMNEPTTRSWLKVLNYEISPKVRDSLLESPARLSQVQDIILSLRVDKKLPEQFEEFITDNLFTSKVTDISSLMCQRDKKLKITVSELLQLFKTERTSVKSVVCDVLTK